MMTFKIGDLIEWKVGKIRVIALFRDDLGDEIEVNTLYIGGIKSNRRLRVLKTVSFKKI